MKKLIFAAAFAIGLSGFANADVLIPTISLTPGSPSYSASGPNQIPAAYTFAGDPDIWSFDLSSFSSAVTVKVSVSDWFPPYPDDYNLYWDGNLLGNTVTAVPGEHSPSAARMRYII